MFFASDNWAGAHPKIAESLSAHAAGFAAAYGASDLDKRVEARFNELFEREVAVFFVSTGTSANSLALASAARPGGIGLCHRQAHIVEDECGAPHYFTNGGRLHPVDGALGRIDPALLRQELQRVSAAGVHHGQPTAVSITQATEIGTIYTPEQIAAIAAIGREHQLPLHLDGARFANALVTLDVSPAEMTWKQGVDVVSFGGTKNGCWCAEALVFMDPDRAREMPFIRKRAAQLFSKSRFVAAQFDAYLGDDLWLDLARHSNALAQRLAAHITASPSLRLAWQPQANEVFAIMKQATYTALQDKGARFYQWNAPHGPDGQLGEGEVMARFVTSFANSEADVDQFAALIA